jgi:hypothetical protein
MRHCKKRRYLYLECTDFTTYLGAETVQHAERERFACGDENMDANIGALFAQWKMLCSGRGEDRNVVSTWRVADWSGQGRQRAVNHARGRIRRNQSRRSFYECFTIILLPFYFHSTCVFCPLQTGHLVLVLIPAMQSQVRRGRGEGGEGERGAIPAFPRPVLHLALICYNDSLPFWRFLLHFLRRCLG